MIFVHQSLQCIYATRQAKLKNAWENGMRTPSAFAVKKCIHEYSEYILNEKKNVLEKWFYNVA